MYLLLSMSCNSRALRGQSNVWSYIKGNVTWHRKTLIHIESLRCLPHYNHRRPSNLLLRKCLERRMCLTLLIVVLHVIKGRE